jgi:hypothetical protein
MFGGSGFSFVAFASAPGFIYTAAVEEFVTASEQNIASFVVNASTTDTASAVDTVAGSYIVNSSVADSAAGVSTFASAVQFGAFITETTQASGIYTAPVDFAVTVTDTAAGGDLLVSAVDFAALVTEVSDASDIIITGAIQNPVIEELCTAADSISSVYEINSLVVDQAEIAEFRNIGGGYSTGAYASGAYSNLGDIITKVSGDSIFCLVNVNSAVIDNAQADDTIFRALIVPRDVNENTAIGGEVFGDPEYAGNIAEDVEASDQTASPDAAFNAGISEGANTTVSTAALSQVQALVQDSATLVGVVSTTATLNPVVDETVQASEDIFTIAQIWITIQESVAAADQAIARFLWEPVNTFEVTDWVPITTAQLELRITVGGGFSAGAISSGPYSGLGGNTTIIPAPEIWETDSITQTTNWELVDTIN